jgi:predicted phage baseplate assembly protein
MPLPELQLDDRRFEDIVAEAKRRIPGYTPEWTDLNESDPGITLVELFAWLTEMILWRLNRVPEKNYLKFLELIGLKPKLPAPAQAHLTFKLVAGSGDVPRLIRQGTQVSLSEQVDGAPVVFETDDNFYAVDAQIQGVQSFDGARFELLDEAHRMDGKFFFPFGARPQRNSALYLGFNKALPATAPLTVRFYAYTAELIEEGQGIEAFSPPCDVAGIDSGDDVFSVPERASAGSGAPPSVVVAWEYWAGTLKKWQKLDVESDATASLTRTGILTFNAPAGGEWLAAKVGLLRKDDDPALFWLRVRIDQVLGGGYEVVPRLEDVLMNTISATNATTIFDELLGASNGLPNQVLQLSSAPVLPSPFELEVDEGEGFVAWQRVSNFAASTREDRHFQVNFATGQVYFGDGEHGRIPPRRYTQERPEEDLSNIRARRYRSGGGGRGNAGPNKITSLQSSAPFVDSVTNKRAAIGGEDEESLDLLKARAPDYLRTRSRAVTASDFEFLARQTPGARIRRARALPLVSPDAQPTRVAGAGLAATDIPVPGVVSVIVIPEALAEEAKPVPTENTLARVAEWLNQHRLLTTQLFVIAPKYRKVEIVARVIVAETASSGDVQQRLERMLLEYFHPLRGGASSAGWEFGASVSFAELYRRILDTAGVKRVPADGVTIFVDGRRIEQCADVPLAADELTYSGQHQVVANYDGR